MEAINGILGIIALIIGLFAFIALISTADNTKKTNTLLRMMLNEQNPERFQFKGSKLLDTKLKKKN